jgi:hypothetical protein
MTRAGTAGDHRSQSRERRVERILAQRRQVGQGTRLSDGRHDGSSPQNFGSTQLVPIISNRAIGLNRAILDAGGPQVKNMTELDRRQLIVAGTAPVGAGRDLWSASATS